LTLAKKDCNPVPNPDKSTVPPTDKSTEVPKHPSKSQSMLYALVATMLCHKKCLKN